ncbi:MAG: HIT domain-containing protein [Candidatus Micrarchaeaceae archaeon]|jgi:histidine triad (HIT) family protein
MEDCIFCKIVKGDVESYKLFENEEFLAILDAFPAVEGQTIILSKEHKPSYAFSLENEELKRVLFLAKEIAKILEEKLKVKKVQLIFAGTSVNHFHAKLYPTEERITIDGKKATPENLAEVRDKLIH